MASQQNASTAPMTNVTNATTHNGTAPITSPQTLFGLPAEWDFLILTAQVTLSAMCIIWLGANSSLRRPPSAAPPKKDKDKKREKEEKFVEGFVATDAIMMPILAGCLLVGLYYLIKWMEDPELLNKIIRTYMSLMSVMSLGKLSADALHLLTSLVFPAVWMDGAGKLYELDYVRRQQVLLGGDDATETVAQDKKTPFPGYLSAVKLSPKLNGFFWEVRHLLTEEWTLRLAMHGLGRTKLKIKLNDMIGFNIAVLATIAYFVTGLPWLSNVLGTAFSYSAFTLMSPTSFAIGTAVLAGLFVYDIVMVFYTPYMITVATKLDVPIKLVFTGSGRSSMLGLGDIVVPGIFIALALRFDHWRHYEKKIKYEPTVLSTEVGNDASGQTTTVTETKYRSVKAPYVNLQGQWGNRLWTTRLTRPFSQSTATPALAAAAFPKTYFYACMGGYALGMVLTLIMLLVFKQGQPALLYLVPCVAGAAWLTGAVRGELGLMCRFTEDGSLDTEDVVVELDGEGNVIKEVGKKEEGTVSGGVEKDRTPRDKEAPEIPRGDYSVFLISLTAPRQPRHADVKND
ncbi:Intramembrane protease 2 [Coniochaeta hoffmannii]|uniref:Intramembrane protease 2 n=1 Tax=Coniochaeta hoffmannii TaxID=91930 RepID=A0AA38RUB8_9PEZI|nr:Intramembrane protease 2 [Coniochaeta hoffmannii]